MQNWSKEAHTGEGESIDHNETVHVYGPYLYLFLSMYKQKG